MAHKDYREPESLTKEFPNNYKQKEDLYASIVQAFQDMKQDKVNMKSWNNPVEELKGATLTMIGESKLRISYHKIFTGMPYEIEKITPDMKKFVDQLASELKKKFRSETKSTLNLTKVKEDRNVEKYSRLFSDSSWALGGGARGHAVGRWYVVLSITYNFDV